MSERGKIIVLFSIVSLFGFYAVRWKYGHFFMRDISMFSFITDLFLILGTVLSILIVVFCVNKIIKRESKGYWIPVVSFVISSLVFTYFSNQISKRNSSTQILHGYYNGGLNGIRLILKENQTYLLDDFGPFGGNEYYGNYLIKNDTIVFEAEFPLGEDRDLIGQKLLIKDNKILTQKDSLGNFVEREFELVIQ